MPKTITDIIPPSRRRQMGETEAPSSSPGMQDMTTATPPPMSPPPPPPSLGRVQPGGRKKFPFGYVIAAVVVILASIALLFAFGGAVVEVTPVMKTASVSGSFTATPSAGDLPYETVSVELTVEKEVSAEGEETVDLPAQGTITIYNGQTKVQELINNTRFETPDGKIFRIRESVRVPAGTEEAPGQLQTTVYADAGGTSYNIGPSTFTLPGLSGGPAFDLVYAKSDTGMSGGFTGTRPSVTDTVRTEEYSAMQAELESGLRSQIGEKVSDAFVLIPGSVFISFVPQPDGDAPSDSVRLVQKGTATAFILPREALARAIAFSTLGVYTGQPVTLKNVDSLSFSSTDGSIPTPGMDLLSFNLSGTVDIVWVVDTEEIAGAIAGKSRDSAKTLLAGFSELETARLVLKPFWVGSLPSDPAEITVKVKEPETAN